MRHNLLLQSLGSHALEAVAGSCGVLSHLKKTTDAVKSIPGYCALFALRVPLKRCRVTTRRKAENELPPQLTYCTLGTIPLAHGVPVPIGQGGSPW